MGLTPGGDTRNAPFLAASSDPYSSLADERQPIGAFLAAHPPHDERLQQQAMSLAEACSKAEQELPPGAVLQVHSACYLILSKVLKACTAASCTGGAGGATAKRHAVTQTPGNPHLPR